MYVVKIAHRTTSTAFEQRETLAASIARFDREEAVYFQARAADNSALAAYARDTGAPADTTSSLQRAAAFFGGEARRSLARLIEPRP
jgi:hypothetical protein